MDDIMSKIGELLSDEESVRQLSELAQMMMSGSTDGESEGADNSEDGSGVGGGFDFSQLAKLSGLAGAFKATDKNAELLLALRPHLGEERQKKVDKAIKLLRLVAVWNVAKESGLLNDIL